MKIIPIAHQAIRNLTLIGLLFAPFALTPGYAVELVGKPVAVGAQAATQLSSAQASSTERALSSDTNGEIPAAPLAPEPPQADDIQHAMDDMRESVEHDFPSDFGGISLNPDTIIPIVAMVLLFGGPVLLMIVLALLHYRAKARRQQNINMNIEKLLAAGRDIPVELLLGEETAVRRGVRGEVTTYTTEDGIMQKGVRNIGLGAGWLLFLTIMFGIKIGSFGFIFIGLGISQVVIWKLSSSPKTDSAQSDNSKTELFKVQD